MKTPSLMSRIEAFDASPAPAHSYRFRCALDFVRWHVEKEFGLSEIPVDEREPVTNEHVRAFVLRVGREYLARRVHRVGATTALELFTWASQEQERSI